MSGLKFFLVFILLAFLDFLVPFYLLTDVSSFWGSFFFWSFLTLVTIVTGSFYIRNTWGGGG
ncbi:MAG: hypothetical protein ACLFN7_03040 [Candidatus Acetothermia bacterium]